MARHGVTVSTTPSLQVYRNGWLQREYPKRDNGAGPHQHTRISGRPVETRERNEVACQKGAVAEGLSC